MAQILQRHCLQRELVLGVADLGIDGEILHRLQIERDTGELRRFFLQAGDDDVCQAIASFTEWLEVDL